MEKLTLPITELPIQVDQSTFTLLTYYLRDSKHLNVERKVNEFGVFQVTFKSNEGVKILYTPERTESIHLFHELINQLKGRKSAEKLMDEINRILERIDFDK